MSVGLPIMVTLNSGSDVNDGVTGWIVPAGSSGEIVGAVENLVDHPELLAGMSARCVENATNASFDFYSKRFLSAVGAFF